MMEPVPQGAPIASQRRGNQPYRLVMGRPGRTNRAARTQSPSVLHDRHVGHGRRGLVVMAAVGAAIGQDTVVLDLVMRAGGQLADLLISAGEGLRDVGVARFY